tara:strand:- start:1011 stop:1871 length:861 start_codon:yes stop_codon:yes gene_type:complete
MLTNPIELAIHQQLNKLTTKSELLSKKVVKGIVKDVETALIKQFATKRDKAFRLRMSNMGKPYCQLWFEKNKPELALPPSSNFIINMLIGDIIEAVFKGLLRQANVEYKDGEQITLDLGDGETINGTPDIFFGDAVDDIKSASPWSYINKFKDFNSLAEKDSFGYIAQLVGYAKATNTKPNGWWVVNKGNGDFKHVKATNINSKQVLAKIKFTYKELKENKFRRCFTDEEETYRKKPSGNRRLKQECSWCSFRHACWPGLQERPSLVSKAEQPPMVSYTEINSVQR